ncbi:hypothetical protein NQ314_014874 [Rhamnusium bicolor]|uniref:Uncharacterized protein n=1 Tax=Rhamnusium bicolor TaxID=1586634 RepID=A0AAV8X0J0_9CUCU|nr:hypothetical protein NQ314_014874 [Rhamnusium bicolor]
MRHPEFVKKYKKITCMISDNGSAISCCTQDGNNAFPIQKRHYACMPIGIPEDDTFFGVFQQRCMNFVRSVLTPRYDCTLGYSQQMNKITHFIDGSSIYGSTPKQTGELRSFEGGKLKVFNDYGRELLPITKESDACLTMEQGSACFSSGELAMEEFDLNLRRGYEFSYDYDEEIDPSIINEFATAAFRFGHSTVNGLLKVV